jgi:hypothetical protein
MRDNGPGALVPRCNAETEGGFQWMCTKSATAACWYLLRGGATHQSTAENKVKTPVFFMMIPPASGCGFFRCHHCHECGIGGVGARPRLSQGISDVRIANIVGDQEGRACK